MHHFARHIELNSNKMQMKTWSFILCVVVVLLCLIRKPTMAIDMLDKQNLNIAMLEDLHGDKLQPVHKLSRKRRYLEFPEGSSIQFVYDLVVAVVDNINYITVSITVALAWELPSKPPSEILEDVEEHLKDGTFGIARNDTASKVTYIDDTDKSVKQTIPPSRVSMPKYKVSQVNDMWNNNNDVYRSRLNDWRRVESNIYSSTRLNPFNTYTTHQEQFKQTPAKWRYPWWSLRHPSTKLTRPKNFVNIFQNQHKNHPASYDFKRPGDHRIFSILGKHNGITNNEVLTRRNFSNLDRIHIRHQRNTRHDLYNAIERYLEKKKLNGHYCILRALCETGQKTEEHEPGSFVAELMRAIFTLPEPLENDILHATSLGHKKQGYDKAHALRDECATHYHQCEHSLWSSNFVL